jgi:hypothetical protein
MIHVAMKEHSSEVFGKVVCEVDCCANAFKFEEILFDPFAEGMVFNIPMLCAGCRLLGHGYCNTCIIVFIENRCGLLWNTNIPTYQNQMHP